MRIRSLLAVGGLCLGGLLTGPAFAAGALVQGDGSFVGGPTEAAQITNVRALLYESQGDTTLIVQAAVGDYETIGSAWILPIPGDIVTEPVTASPLLLDEMLRASDPLFQTSVDGCGSSGCVSSVGDSGTLAEVETFDETTATTTWTRFEGNAIEPALASLESGGFTVSSELADGMRTHAASGGSFVVVYFTGAKEGTASPAVAIRYRGPMMMPQALTRTSAKDSVQTVVLTITDHPTSPQNATTTYPEMGQPLYEPRYTPAFYQGRVRVAIAEAGGNAWVLEYSNELSTLEARREMLAESELWDPNDKVPWSGLRKLAKTTDALDEFEPTGLWITRWRTIQLAENLVDQTFVPDDNVGMYEVFVPANEYVASWLWAAPVGLGIWAMGRRRRHLAV